MKQRIMNHVGFLTALSILVTFFAASVVMYQKYNSYMRQDVKMNPSICAMFWNIWGKNISQRKWQI